jgi:bifunctional non-homologous end joining protein LigD
MAAVDVEGHRLQLTNLQKVLYPESGTTKGEVLDYYARVAPTLVEHLRGRAMTLKRYPDGVAGPHFYDKHCRGRPTSTRRRRWSSTSIPGSPPESWTPPR